MQGEPTRAAREREIMAILQTAFAAAKAAYDKGVTANHLTGLDINGPWLHLEIRADAQGQPYLYFPFMAISDMHLGTRQSRAKRTSHLLEHTRTSRLYVDGDDIDGQHLLEKESAHFAPWHRQVLGHILRKTETSDVIEIPGNHNIELPGKRLKRESGEAWHRKLTGKRIFGIKVMEEDLYCDPKGRHIRIVHGDVFDGCISFWYSFGDFFHNPLVRADVAIQNIPRLDGFSIAAKGKCLIKTIINEFMGVNKEITRVVDSDPLVDGVIYGHSHMGDLACTPAGKLKLNSGCCTEHVQALVHDSGGTYALITWHKNSLEILEESGRRRKYSWDELGLEAFKREPTLFKDRHTQNADRLIRLVDHLWPSKNRRKEIREARERDVVPAPLDLPLPQRAWQRPVYGEELNAV
jgi:UDP-2,3-diacylglucosamine pyrophosphatase LpxH